MVLYSSGGSQMELDQSRSEKGVQQQTFIHAIRSILANILLLTQQYTVSYI